ncbi:MAG: hypothetical protein AB7E04_06845 [Desulfobacteraceae bacterium]
MSTNFASAIGAFIPLLIIHIPFIFICRKLAQDKGKNSLKYTLLGCIPLINYLAFLYLVGTPNNILNDKIDQILNKLDSNKL